MSHSEDLRRRVVKYVRQGGNRNEAARLFGVSRWCVFNWLKRGDALTPGKPGPRDAVRLSREKLRAALQKKPDAILKELAKQMGVSTSCVWYNLQQMKISRKKNVDVRRSGAL
jgi:transposase